VSKAPEAADYGSKMAARIPINLSQTHPALSWMAAALEAWNPGAKLEPIPGSCAKAALLGALKEQAIMRCPTDGPGSSKPTEMLLWINSEPPGDLRAVFMPNAPHARMVLVKLTLDPLVQPYHLKASVIPPGDLDLLWEDPSDFAFYHWAPNPQINASLVHMTPTSHMSNLLLVTDALSCSVDPGKGTTPSPAIKTTYLETFRCLRETNPSSGCLAVHKIKPGEQAPDRVNPWQLYPDPNFLLIRVRHSLSPLPIIRFQRSDHEINLMMRGVSEARPKSMGSDKYFLPQNHLGPFGPNYYNQFAGQDIASSALQKVPKFASTRYLPYTGTIAGAIIGLLSLRAHQPLEVIGFTPIQCLGLKITNALVGHRSCRTAALASGSVAMLATDLSHAAFAYLEDPSKRAPSHLASNII
jgi:hypothetical protein